MKKIQRKMWFLPLLLLLSLLMAACGGNDAVEPVAEPTTTTGALRPAQESTTAVVTEIESETGGVDEVVVASTAVAVATANPTNIAPVPVTETAVTIPAPSIPSEGYPVALQTDNPPAGYPVTAVTTAVPADDTNITATGSTTTTTPVAPPTPTIDPNQVFTDVGPTETTAEEVLREIFADLQKNFGVEAGDVEIEEIVAGSWSSSALGCPEPDTAYADVIAPGYMVTLVVGYDLYIYHTDDALNVVRCDQPGREAITPLPDRNE